MWERPLVLTLRAFEREELTPTLGRFSSEDFLSAKVGYFTFPATPLWAALVNDPPGSLQGRRKLLSACSARPASRTHTSGAIPQLQSQLRGGTLSKEGKMELKPTWDAPTFIQPGGQVREEVLCPVSRGVFQDELGTLGYYRSFN